MKNSLKTASLLACAMMLMTGLGMSSPVSLHAQNEFCYERGQTQAEDILPPSPEAASAVKYADVPFTHSLGAAEYNIPLYELKGRQLTIPIGLNYRSNGIKVDEIAGVAGLGWTLQAGGVVTREVVYMPDEFKDFNFYYEQPDETLLYKLDSRLWDYETQGFLEKTVWHQRDRSSDRYSYSVAGLSGTFIVTPAGDIVQMSGDGVTIHANMVSYTDHTIRSFVIKGPDGIRYTFAERETGIRKTPKKDAPSYSTGQNVEWTATTAWYLTDITSADGTEHASLEYTEGYVWQKKQRSVTESVTYSNQPVVGDDGGTTIPAPHYGSSNNWVDVKDSTKLLQRITLRGFAAEFSYENVYGQVHHLMGSNQERIYNFPHKLSQIRILSPSSGELARYAVDTYRNSYDGRVLLRKVEEYHLNELTDRWEFSYRTLNNQISHYSQDWFGYFNGEENDGFFFYLGTCPGRSDTGPFALRTGITGNYELYYQGGTPDGNQASYLMLETVDHDGAKTQFTYEGAESGHTDDRHNNVTIGVRVKEIVVKDGSSPVQHRTFTYEQPKTTAEWQPVVQDYMTSSVFQNSVESGEYYTWTVTLHEQPVKEGRTISSCQVIYGKVTERVTEDAAGFGGVRTVYYYDASPSQTLGYLVGDRFPSSYSGVYSAATRIPSPSLGIPTGYWMDCQSYPALLTKKESYRLDATGDEELYECERTEYGNLRREWVLTDYKALQVFQVGRYAGYMTNDQLMYYPVWSYRAYNTSPTRVVRTGYHAGGQDSTVVEYTYVARPTLETPVRVDTLCISGSDCTRRVRYTYADTWPAATRPAWATSLLNRHSLQEPLVEEYERLNAQLVTFSQRVEREYSSFMLPNHGYALMPSLRRELTDGTESWREEVLSRDGWGNPASLKERGRPQLTVTWGYDGMYPVSITEGSGTTTLTTTYTWSPGVGITGVTDPKGTTTSYSYDAAGRLSEVRDYDNRKKDRYVYALLNTGTNRRSVRHQVYRDDYGLQFSEDVSWWNTLGMKTEDIAEGAGGSGQDLVTAYEGDYLLHDDVKSWLPYPVTATQGAFQTGAPSASATYHADTLAYQYRGYERSRRDRVERTRLPGYGSAHENVQSDDVRANISRLVWSEGYGVVNVGTYPSSEVLEERMTDADGRVRVTLKDRFGTVLVTERRSSSMVFGAPVARTKYVYDPKGRLRAVVGDGIALTDTLNMWRYSYDNLGRMKSKGIPGSEREFYTYDNEDRVIAVRRGVTHTDMEYDALGRLRKVWVRISGGLRELVEEHRYDSLDSDANSVLGYGGYLWPADSYTTGLETYVKKAVTDGNGWFTGSYVESAGLYDGEGRPIYVVTRYPEGSQERTAVRQLYEYDLSGNAIWQVEEVETGLTGSTWSASHSGLPTVKLTTQKGYDLRSRPVQVVSRLEGAGMSARSDTTTISYDALGRPSQTLSRSGGTPVTVTDSYTLQGWLNVHAAKVGAYPLFSETLYYETAPDSDGYGVSWTGLVTTQKEVWSDPPTLPLSQTTQKRYRYDVFGRLDRSKLQTGFVLGGGYLSNKEESFSYDGRGNLLTRYQTIDQINGFPHEESTYTGDRLVSRSVVAAINNQVLSTVTFTHDALGRMTHDGTQNLDITYNYLDMPEKVSRNDTLLVKYSYLADGMKTGARSSAGEGLEYRGTMTFRRSAQGALTFESVPFVAGRMTGDGVRYYVTDHLGSVRAVLDGDTGNLLEASDYSAFGTRRQPQLPSLLTNQLNNSTPSMPFRHHFTGQEEQVGITSSLSLPYTDFGARHYSPTLSRWLVPDPLSEKYYDVSPYAYCANDPVNKKDVGGKVPWAVAGAASAALDFSVQVGIKRLEGYSWGESLKAVDFASVGASFVLGALSPISTASKIGKIALSVAKGAAVIGDAAVDFNLDKGLQIVGSSNSNKTGGGMLVDAAASCLAGDLGRHVPNTLAEGLKKEASNKATATLTKEVKQARIALSEAFNKPGMKAAEGAIINTCVSLGKEAINKATEKEERVPLVLSIDQGEIPEPIKPNEFFYNPTF